MVEVRSFLPARKERNTQGRILAVAISSPSQPRQTRITIVLKSPRRSTQRQLHKRNVERNENGVLHHETGLANQLLVCAMQRHALGGTYNDNKHHLDN